MDYDKWDSWSIQTLTEDKFKNMVAILSYRAGKKAYEIACNELSTDILENFDYCDLLEYSEVEKILAFSQPSGFGYKRRKLWMERFDKAFQSLDVHSETWKKWLEIRKLLNFPYSFEKPYQLARQLRRYARKKVNQYSHIINEFGIIELLRIWPIEFIRESQLKRNESLDEIDDEDDKCLEKSVNS